MSLKMIKTTFDACDASTFRAVVADDSQQQGACGSMSLRINGVDLGRARGTFGTA
jgi:hypothetical protein